METMSSLHHHLCAKPKERSLYGATRRDISVKMNSTRRVRLPARVPSSSSAVKCSAAFRPEGHDEEGQSKFKSFGINTDFGTSLLMTYFPLSAALGDVLGPAEKIDHVLSSYEDKLEKLKVIQRTVGVQIGGDGGEHDYLVKLDRVEQLIYQGQFEFAKQYCEKHILLEAPPQDYRPRFYLVVSQVMLMLDLVEKTSEYWKEIVDGYKMFRVPIKEPHEDDAGGPMLSSVEDGEEDRQLELFLELMKIFKQAISGATTSRNSTGYLDNLSPPSHKA